MSLSLLLLKSTEGTNFMIVDTHAHLDFPDYDNDLNKVFQDAKDAGVEHIINVGVDLESSRKSVVLANEVIKGAESPNIVASIGIHPNKASDLSSHEFDKLKGLLSHKKIVAIGETGLDYYRDHSKPEDQEALFRSHLELAIDANLPVIIHNRDANKDCLRVVKQYADQNLKGVVHCFSADKDFAKEFLDLGFYISFTGAITYPKARTSTDVVKSIPTSRLLLETDSPFLSPQAKRGKRNEPSFLKYVVPFLANVFELSNSDIERVTSQNANELFGVGLQQTKGEISYVIRNSLYLNITNKCPNDCTFCDRNIYPYVKGHYLKLDNEPTVEELIGSYTDPSTYDEVVFCGFGEPTERLDVLKSVAEHLKENGATVRLDTNGLGDLINKRHIAHELKGLVDSVSISLNANQNEQYTNMCKPVFGNDAYPAVLSFIKEAKKAIPRVTVSVVDMPGVDVAACRRIAEDLGVFFKLRKYNDTGFKND